MRYEVKVIGRVESPLADVAAAPRQADEGAPEAWLVFDAEVLDALADVRPGDEAILLTWLHRADRGVLRVHPRDDLARPLQGVFSTRSPDRPNPIGLHRVTIETEDRIPSAPHASLVRQAKWSVSQSCDGPQAQRASGSSGVKRASP